MVKGVIALVLCIILIPIAFALHSASISSDYIPIYETNNINLTLTVTNGMFSLNSINEVDIQQSMFNALDIFSIVDWTLTNNSTINFFTAAAMISNWASQSFGFSLSAPNVEQDTAAAWTITTTDTSSDSETNSLQLQVLNDNTAPIITATSPGQYMLGTNNELFSITADDPETGISSAELYYSNCDLLYSNETNTSGMVFSKNSLSCSGSLCSQVADLSSENEGDVCYSYNVSNNGGETADSGLITGIIDRTGPAVELNGPTDGAIFGMTIVNLRFTAVDNFDAALNCTIAVNNVTYNITSEGYTEYSLVIGDGNYQWFVSCRDEVNQPSASETRGFIVDNRGPDIAITVPAANDRGSDVVIDVSITDEGSGVNESSITAEIIDPNLNAATIAVNNNQVIYPTDISTAAGDYTVIITASDNIGFTTTQTKAFRIREAYSIILSINPAQIDASTPNNTLYSNLSGNIIRDDGFIPLSIEIAKILSTDTLDVDNATGDFSSEIEIPETTGGYIIIARYMTALDEYNATALITVGPYCGNGNLDPGEECDITTAAICSDYGYSQGSASCTASCTIDTSGCSNPSAPSGGGGGGNGGNGQNQYILTQPEVVVIENETGTTGGIIETPEPVAEEPEETEPIAEEEIIAEEPEQEQPDGTGIGIGASWAVFTELGKKTAVKAIAALALIGGLLYMFGWKGKGDDWDKYFKKYGHN